MTVRIFAFAFFLAAGVGAIQISGIAQEVMEETEAETKYQESEKNMQKHDYIAEELWAKNGQNNIFGIVYRPKSGSASKFPTVILSHGFGGNHMNLQDYAQLLAENGYAAYVFDFCGGGTLSRSDGSMLDMSLLTEREDLIAVVSMIKEQPYVDDEQIFLAGGSQGGAVSAITAPQIKDDIQGMILFYPAFVIVDDVHKTFDSIEELPETYTVLGNRIGRRYAEDVFDMDLYEESAGFSKDVLIIHGSADEIVPVDYSVRAAEMYENAVLHVIPEAGHGFSGEDREKTKNYVLDYMKNHVKQ